MIIIKARKLSIFAAIWTLCIAALAHGATLELISSAPANNAVDISRTDPLTLQFSATVTAKSVTTATIQLHSAAGIQKVALTVSGTVVSVRSLTPLLPWTVYTLNVQSLTGNGGEQLTTPIALGFTTRDATWQPSQQVDQLTTNQFSPVTAVNAKGIRFIAWLQSNESGAGDDIWAIRQVPGAISTSATLVASFPQNYASELNVRVDDDGNAFATWVVDTASPQPRHIWANRFATGNARGSGWGTPQIIDGYSTSSGTNLHLVFDHAGNALALWQQYDCCAIHSSQAIIANRYTRATGWSKPVRLDHSDSLLNGRIDIQVDNAGDAYATWSIAPAYFLPTATLQVSRYEAALPNGGWSDPQTIATESTESVMGEQALAVNPRGEAFLMWTDDSGLQFARADASGNWSKPILIDSTITMSPSQMVLLDDGEAFAAFLDGVKNFIPAKALWSWTHPLLTDQNASSDPHIVADASGNALVAWTQTVSGIDRIYAKRYRANRGWFGSILIDSGDTLGAELQELFLQPDGSAVAAWSQNNDSGTTDIETASFE